MMIGLYVMLSIFAAPPVAFAVSPVSVSPGMVSQLVSTSHPVSISDVGSLAKHQEMVVSFQHINGIKLGTAVISRGHVVGQVAGIELLHPEASSSSKQADSSYQVKIELNIEGALDHQQPISTDVVALQTMPITKARTTPEMVVELFPAPPAEVAGRFCKNQSAEVICGFSSYEEFWSAGPPVKSSSRKHRHS